MKVLPLEPLDKLELTDGLAEPEAPKTVVPRIVVPPLEPIDTLGLRNRLVGLITLAEAPEAVEPRTVVPPLELTTEPV